MGVIRRIIVPMQYQGKDYRWEKNGDKVRFLIDGKDGIEERKNSFYKYYALNKYSVDSLTHLYIYDTHPCQLNDPLDCAEHLIEFDDNETTRIMLGDMFSEVSNIYQNDEKEYVATDKRKNNILSFLSLTKIPTYVLDTDELEVVKVPIEITKIRNDAYRINY